MEKEDTSSVEETQMTVFEPSIDDAFDDERWPVWLRLVTIIGLSAGLWAAIIWAVVPIVS